MALRLDILEKKDNRGGLFAVEKASIIYGLITLILAFIFIENAETMQKMILSRAIIWGITIFLAFVFYYYPSKIMAFVRVGFQLSLLSYWYPETYEFNRLFENLDHVFAGWEQSIFNSQPALTFSANYPQAIVSESLNMGYFFYYPMMLVVCAYYFFAKFKGFEKVSFILITSFFIYYFIYIFLPVSGPQFYFEVIGLDNAHNGIFPSIGNYFSENQFTMLKAPGYEDGLFYKLVGQAQQAGERPTAAFPSSHIGVSTILMIMSWRGNKLMFFLLFPIYLLLCGATVYIQAHYLIDGIAGVISGFIIFYVVEAIYNRWFKVNVFYEETNTMMRRY